MQVEDFDDSSIGKTEQENKASGSVPYSNTRLPSEQGKVPVVVCSQPAKEETAGPVKKVEAWESAAIESMGSNASSEQIVISNADRAGKNGRVHKAPAKGGKHEKDQRYSIELTLQKSTKIIDKKKTIMSSVVTNDRVLQIIVKFYRLKIVNLMIPFLWLVCNANFLSICFQRPILSASVYAPMQIIYTLHFIMYHAIFIRMDIVKALLRSFNFWFTFLNLISLIACYVWLWGLSTNIYCAALHSTFSTLLLLLFDAHSMKHLRLMKISAFLGIISISVVIVILFLELIDFQQEKFYYGSLDFEIIDVRLQAYENATTLIVYLLRIIYNHLVLNKTSTIVFLSRFYELPATTRSKVRSKYQSSSYQEPGLGENGRKSQELDEQAGERSVDQTAPGSLHSSELGSMPEENVSDNQPNASEHRRMENPGLPDVVVGDLIDPRRYLVMGIMESKVIEYDLQDTLFHRYIKKKSPLFTKVLRSRVYSAVGILCSILSLPLSFVLASGVDCGLVTYYVGLAVNLNGIIFIFIQSITVSNMFMVRHMIRSFDYWFVLFLIFRLLLSSGVLCHWDSRMVFWVFVVLIFHWSIMVESFQIKSRKMAYLSVLGVVWMFSSAILCKLRMGRTFENEKWIELDGHPFISIRIVLSSSAFSTCILALRFFWSFYRNPNRVLFLTENVVVDKLA